MDVKIKEKIRELVYDGLVNPGEVKRYIEIFSKSAFPEAAMSDRRYYPTANDIRNHVFMALNKKR